MATLSQAKTLGGVGSILVLLTIIPAVGWLLAIVGFIMSLIAVKYISEVLGDSKIFTNMIIGIILSIVGVAVAAIVVLGAVFSFIGLGALRSGTGGYGGYSSTGTVPPDIFGLLGTIALGLGIVWVVYIVSAVFIRRGYSTISKRLGVGLFGTAALLYLIGAALAIILVGFVLIFVAQILLIVAFFSIPEQIPMAPVAPSAYAPPPPPPPPPPAPSPSA